MTLSRPFDQERLRLTIGCSLALFMTGAIGAAPGAVIPQWQAEFDITKQVAWYFNLFFVGGLVGTFLNSRLKIRHPWLSLALVAEGIGLLVIALSPQFSGVLFAAILLSLGISTANFHSNSIPSELYTNNRAVVLSRVNAVFGVGAVLSPLIMVWLPWRSGYVILALVAFAAAVLLWTAPPVQSNKAEKQQDQRHLLPLLLAAMVAYVAVEVVVSSFTGVYLRKLGYDKHLVGILLSLYWVGLTLGRLVLPSFLASNPLARLTQLHIATVVVVMVCFIPQAAWIFPIIGFLVGPTFPTFYTFAQSNIGYFALAYMFYFGAVGGTLVPAGFALVPKDYIAFGILIVVALMVSATHLLRRKSEAQSPVV